MTFTREPDIEALIHLLPHAADAGRQTPACDGYRPQHRLRDGYDTSGLHHYQDRDSVAPGETARGTITFVTPEVYPHSLREGDVLDIFEGSRLVGQATVLSVLNPDLERAG